MARHVNPIARFFVELILFVSPFPQRSCVETFGYRRIGTVQGDSMAGRFEDKIRNN